MTDRFATLTVRDFSARGDGRTDDTSAFQSALAACEESGGGVQFLEVTYPEQTLDPGSLIDYPWAIRARGENCHIIGADATVNAVVVEQSNDHTGGILISNGEFVSIMSDDSVPLVVKDTNRAFVSLNNCGFWGPSHQIARIAGSGNVALTGNQFIQWDKQRTGAPANEIGERAEIGMNAGA